MRVSLLVFVAALCAGGCGSRVADGTADGAAVYAEACARCHGPSGVPDQGQVIRLGVKNLTRVELQERLSDDDIAQQIVNGSQNQQMPAFAGVLSDAQVRAVVRYVRTLRAER
jgi:cytochrome c6